MSPGRGRELDARAAISSTSPSINATTARREAHARPGLTAETLEPAAERSGEPAYGQADSEGRSEDERELRPGQRDLDPLLAENRGDAPAE